MSSLPNNNDFLNTDNSVSEPTKNKRRTALEIEMDKYPEYYALNEYDRRCLVANNYFRVLYGDKTIEVPPSDKHYEKYFDYRCYDRARGYQQLKKREAEFNVMYKKLTEKTINYDEGNGKPIGDVKIEVKVDEIKDVINVKKEEPEPIKQNIVPEKKQKIKKVNDKKNDDNITPSLF